MYLSHQFPRTSQFVLRQQRSIASHSSTSSSIHLHRFRRRSHTPPNSSSIQNHTIQSSTITKHYPIRTIPIPTSNSYSHRLFHRFKECFRPVLPTNTTIYPQYKQLYHEQPQPPSQHQPKPRRDDASTTTKSRDPVSSDRPPQLQPRPSPKATNHHRYQ